MYMYYSSQYYKDESTKVSERAAAEKQCILASRKEADERLKEMACKIAALEVIHSSEE